MFVKHLLEGSVLIIGGVIYAVHEAKQAWWGTKEFLRLRRERKTSP